MMDSATKIDSLVAHLVAAKLDPTKSRLFATEISREAVRYKPTGMPAHVKRERFIRIADSFEESIRAIDQAVDEGTHWDSAHDLSAYARRNRRITIGLSNEGVFDRAIKAHWPQMDHVPLIQALREYLRAYAAEARAQIDSLPTRRKGGLFDIELYRPVLCCARAWVRTFETKPGRAEKSPFVRACRLALPLFGQRVPTKLHAHVARALREVDLSRIK
jgi:hypothetical protein